jgi:8-oxo-dGTP diphosphatase
MDRKNLYDYLMKIQAITKIGLLYSNDPYALRNYEELQTLTLTMLEELQDVSLERNNYFERDVYPTPNISIRTIVFNDNDEFLMVKEVVDDKYSFPGGWVDIYDTPSEAALREVKEEAGADIELTGLVAVLSRNPYKGVVGTPNFVVVFKGNFIRFTNNHDHEISDVRWFSKENIPALSHTTNIGEVNRIINAALSGEVIFD